MFSVDKNKRYGFMAGCSLPSYNPQAVIAITKHLDENLAKFSAVQKCCGKPTKSVGQYELFKERFASLQADMDSVEIDEMIVACQSCKLTFDSTSKTKTYSLWEVFPVIGLPREMIGKAKDSNMLFTIHDSCPTRFDKDIQNGIRWIINELGYKVRESEYSREKTRCCGFGGMVGAANPEVAIKVMNKRVETLDEKNIVVYCSACRSSIMEADANAWHILDLVFGPVVYDGDLPPRDVLSSPIKSWINRYKSKRSIDIIK